jgi:spore coat polysaccharide biosynthesis protein SpsF
MYKTEQENFWAGDFGNEYIDRNNCPEQLASYLCFWSKIFKCRNGIRSVIEFGANIGGNIRALKMLLPLADLDAIEINKTACEQLTKIDGLTVFNGSILEIDLKKKYDLVFMRGVLIHINPDELQNVYRRMYECTNNGGYILLDEYFNPYPIAIDYRGEKDKLFKRDFAGELMDRYPDLELIDYGCTYHRDGWNDDSNWFLMKKNR